MRLAALRQYLRDRQHSMTQKELDEVLDMIALIQYPMDQWVTISEYCKRFNIPNTQTITNWIQRGIVPKENVLTIPEYNNIRLIKAVPYHNSQPS